MHNCLDYELVLNSLLPPLWHKNTMHDDLATNLNHELNIILPFYVFNCLKQYHMIDKELVGLVYCATSHFFYYKSII